MPNHTDNDHTSNGMQCHEFDSLLSDVIDGLLTGSQLDRFQAHARSCSACGPLLAEVEAGRNWLKELSEVEPPAGLVSNILASTTGVDSQRLRVNVSAAQPQVAVIGASWVERVQAWLSGAMQPVWATVRQPRFAMSFGMAFFALSVGLSVLGVKPTDLRQISLRPAAIRHTYYNTEARVVRYYDNIRLVYQMQAAASKLKRNVTPAEPAPEKKDHKNDTTEQPDQKQERNYSQTQDQMILAAAPVCVGGQQCWIRGQECPRHTECAPYTVGPSVVYSLNQDLPVVSVTTYRRLV
jgi:hypothetical protein